MSPASAVGGCIINKKKINNGNSMIACIFFSCPSQRMKTRNNRPRVTLPIEGLYIVGGDAGGWGIGTEMAANSAIDCSKTILKDIQN